MNDEVITRYLDRIPSEIRDAVSELSSAQRWAVFISILKEDRYFNELKRELGISAEQLDNILRRLIIGGLVYREMTSPAEIGDRKKIYYTVTPIGKNLVRGLLEGFLSESRSSDVRKTNVGYGLQKNDKLLVCEADTISSPHRRTGYLHLPKKAGSLQEEKPVSRNYKTGDPDDEKTRSRPGKRAIKNHE